MVVSVLKKEAMTNDFRQLEEVYQILKSLSKSWFICGGWAIDLALGHKTRKHKDIDIGIFREDQLELRNYLSDWNFLKIVPQDRKKVEWKKNEYLALPMHETRANKDDQEIEFLLNDYHENNWIFRRNPNVHVPIKKLIKYCNHLPYWTPEVSLLFKAKIMRDNDEFDFENIIEFLTPESKQWLQTALEATHPGHAWIKRLV